MDVEYATSLLGCPYTNWTSVSTNHEPHPFYIDEPKPIEYIKEHGVNCAGFCNLLLHRSGKPIPGDGEYKGGTAEYLRHYTELGVVKSYDINT